MPGGFEPEREPALCPVCGLQYDTPDRLALLERNMGYCVRPDCEANLTDLVWPEEVEEPIDEV